MWVMASATLSQPDAWAVSLKSTTSTLPPLMPAFSRLMAAAFSLASDVPSTLPEVSIMNTTLVAPEPSARFTASPVATGTSSMMPTEPLSDRVCDGEELSVT